MRSFAPRRCGWHPDLPDLRDYTPQSPIVTTMFSETDLAVADRPDDVDWRDFFAGIVDRPDIRLNDSCSQACVSLLQYFVRRAVGDSIEPSTLFLHQLAGRLAGALSLPGLDLRSHMRAMITFGLPPAQLWPYESGNVDRAPEPLLFSFAEPYRSICYVRLDSRDGSGRQTLETVKAFIAAGFPAVFGVSVPSTLTTDCDIPFCPASSFVRGGEALVALGYDDRRLRASRGALLVRPCWGELWGDKGYGWLPYAFVEQQLANCFWTLVDRRWLDMGEFECPECVTHDILAGNR